MLHALLVLGELRDVHAGLEGTALAGVDDDADVGVGLELEPGHGELVAHRAFMALSCAGRLLISQPTGPWRSTSR